MTRNSKEKSIIGPLAGVMAVITIIAIFAVVIFRQTVAQQQKEQKVAQAMTEIKQEQEEEQQAQVAEAKLMTADAAAARPQGNLRCCPPSAARWDFAAPPQFLPGGLPAENAGKKAPLRVRWPDPRRPVPGTVP